MKAQSADSNKNEASHGRQEVPGCPQIKGGHYGEGSTAGSQKIRGIHPMSFFARRAKKDPDNSSCEKKGDSHDKIGEEHDQPLPAPPNELKGIEARFLRQTETQRKSQGRQEAKKQEPRIQFAFHSFKKQEQERSGGPESQKSETDDHVGKVLPPHNAQEAHQQNFISQNGKGGKKKKAVKGFSRALLNGH
jgi:hypothetical protein